MEGEEREGEERGVKYFRGGEDGRGIKAKGAAVGR